MYIVRARLLATPIQLHTQGLRDRIGVTLQLTDLYSQRPHRENMSFDPELRSPRVKTKVHSVTLQQWARDSARCVARSQPGSKLVWWLDSAEVKRI